MDLNSMTTAQLTDLYNEFVENMLAENDPIKPAKKFKTVTAGVERIERLMLNRGLTFNPTGDKLVQAEIPMSDTAIKEAGASASKGKKAPKERVPRVAMDHKAGASTNHTLRPGSNQAILAASMVKGITLRAATELLNKERIARNPASSLLSKAVISGTMSYDLVKLKGYGVRSENWNGEKLYEAGFKDDAADLGYGTTEYKPELTKAVYFLVLPAGLTAPEIKASEPAPKPEKPAKAAKEPKAAKAKSNGGTEQAPAGAAAADDEFVEGEGKTIPA
jgi:hypothetical protein